MRRSSLLILLLFSLLSSLKSQDKSLNGKWFLQEIQLNDSLIVPESKRFYLVFEGNEILFNKEKNKCGMKAVIKDNRISDCRGACTKVCCDEWYGTTSKYFDVNGSYSVKENRLIIENKWGQLIYQKSEE